MTNTYKYIKTRDLAELDDPSPINVRNVFYDYIRHDKGIHRKDGIMI